MTQPREPADRRDQPLNFVFIVADDLGWADVGCYGADLHETPNIDRLAASGVRFTDAYAAAPVCSPTRASILTGRHPGRLHMTIWSEAAESPPRNLPLIPPITNPHLPPEETTVADVLQQRWFMAHVGKWHLGEASYYPEARGFHLNIAGTHWGCPVTYFYPYKGWFNSEEFRYIPDLESGHERPDAYLTDRLTDEALRIIETVHDRPFFLNLWYYTVHTPIEGKPEWIDYHRGRVRPDFHHRNPGYAAMVSSLDENVGRVLDTLDRLGIADRTVVFFYSDNGGYIGNYRGERVTDNHPLRSGKGALYEGGIRVPLIVRWPGVTPEGAVCREPVSSTDFFRTILDMAGLASDSAWNRGVDGCSLVPVLRDPTATLDRDALFWHYPHYYETTTPVSAVRTRDWKLLEFFEDGRTELYRVSDDIGEQRDLSREHPEIVRELHDRLRDWRADVDAQLPTPNPDFRRGGN